MTSDQTLKSKQRNVRDFLRDAASRCGSLLNSVMVVLGRFGLYKTGQYSSHLEEPIAPRRVPDQSASHGPE